MPRSARRKSRTNIYHVVLRGINRQMIFEEPEDAYMFLKILNKFKDKSRYKIYGYCLMGNHVHLLIEEGVEELGIVMRRIGASFVYWYNTKYERNGHLFQDRFKSEVVEDYGYLLNVIRYIHQNPVKAKIVMDVSKYQWSSYSEYIGKSRIIDREFILRIIDKDEKRALGFFRDFHKEESEDSFLDIHENQRLSDREAVEVIKEICQVTHCIELQKLTKKDGRDRQIKSLKEQGLSTRQIARLTGISRGVIVKA
ncbi:transposase [Fredinandcohnia humi]